MSYGRPLGRIKRRSSFTAPEQNLTKQNTHRFSRGNKKQNRKKKKHQGIVCTYVRWQKNGEKRGGNSEGSGRQQHPGRRGNSAGRLFDRGRKDEPSFLSRRLCRRSALPSFLPPPPSWFCRVGGGADKSCFDAGAVGGQGRGGGSQRG